MYASGFTRRDFLGAGLATLAVPWMSGPSLFANPPKREIARDGRLFLFLDWFHVQKGEMKVSLDPERISSEGRKILDTYERDFNKKFDQTGHGLKSDAPYGVQIVQETAERGKLWLVADQPWEKSVSSPTVLFDEGRYRCWYIARLKGETEATTVDQERVMAVTGSALAYAESVDGENWVKPPLKILSYNRSLDNNLVCPFNNGGAVFRDEHGFPD